ncbi:MAG TPA: 30S ribosomal protein S3, partial [Myxococcales bacterium]|nr:30S ribosomal protein S3 [Myxococcales bacterium]
MDHRGALDSVGPGDRRGWPRRGSRAKGRRGGARRRRGGGDRRGRR